MKKISYGWAVCAACTMLIFITMGTVSNGFSIFLPYIIKECGLTHAQGSSLITMRCLSAFVAIFFIGKYYEIFSIRLGTFLAALSAAVAFVIYALADSYYGFAVGALITGITYGLGSMVPVSILMRRWFSSNSTLALGICATGSGIATIVLPGIITFLVRVFGMGTAFMIIGISTAVISILIFAIVRDYPYGHRETVQRGEKDMEKAFVLSGKLWLILGICALFMGALANPGFSHIPVLFSEEGFSEKQIAFFVTIVGFTIIIGKIACGHAADRFGGFWTSIVFAGFLLIGNMMCMLSFMGNAILSEINMIILGFGYPLATIGLSVWASDFAGNEGFSLVLRRLQVIYAGGALIFAGIPGILADIFESYTVAYLMFSIMQAIVVVLLVIAYREFTPRHDA